MSNEGQKIFNNKVMQELNETSPEFVERFKNPKIKLELTTIQVSQQTYDDIKAWFEIL